MQKHYKQQKDYFLETKSHSLYDKVLKRPLLLYHGSKYRIAEWIISYFSQHRIFLDLFGGSASLLLKKPRAEIEIYNDLDGEIVNLLKVVRDRGPELAQKLYLTPYARDEFKKSFTPSDDSLEQARRTMVRSFQGFGGACTTAIKGSKISSESFRVAYKHGNRPQVSWQNLPENLLYINERLKGVCIENLDFRKALKRYNKSDVLVYADPPYLSKVRDYGKDYRFELSQSDHIELSELLHEHKGPVIISGYSSNLYDRLYKGWIRKEYLTHSLSNKKCTEIIWMNKILNYPIQGELF